MIIFKVNQVEANLREMPFAVIIDIFHMKLLILVRETRISSNYKHFTGCTSFELETFSYSALKLLTKLFICNSLQ